MLSHEMKLLLRKICSKPRLSRQSASRVPFAGLTEDMAWPARPQDTYGLEKLYAEEMCLAYAKDFPIQTRMARYHNVYGPRGTWKGKYSWVLVCVL